MLRRTTGVTVRPAQRVAMRYNGLAALGAGYNCGPFQNPVRRPQLTEAERQKVTIDQSTWPKEFQDYDPQNPYKNFSEFFPGLTSFQLGLLGLELSFVITMWEMVFYPSI
jgi:hypothetical protein